MHLHGDEDHARHHQSVGQCQNAFIEFLLVECLWFCTRDLRMTWSLCPPMWRACIAHGNAKFTEGWALTELRAQKAGEMTLQLGVFAALPKDPWVSFPAPTSGGSRLLVLRVTGIKSPLLNYKGAGTHIVHIQICRHTEVDAHTHTHLKINRIPWKVRGGGWGHRKMKPNKL